MKLLLGYSHKTVQTNLAAMLKAGYPRKQAIFKVLNLARQSYFREHPQGALPVALAFPAGRRLAIHYKDNGEPIFSTATRQDVGKNPVSELPIPKGELAAIQRNVQKALTGQGAAVRKAAKLYTEFTGHEDTRISKVKIPEMSSVALAFGQCDGIMYSTVRDGVPEKYIHTFKSKSRPLIAASPDGNQLYLIGGSYSFTDRGIVDKT